MIASWMVYAVVVALLLGVAALAAETVLIRWRLPSRGVWAASLIGLFLVPVVGAIGYGARGTGASAAPVEFGPLQVLEGLGAAADEGEGFARNLELPAWDEPLLAVWLLGSSGLLVFLAFSHFDLRRRRRNWRPAVVAGARVRLSDEVGPAVVGFAPGEIVLPKWAMRLPPEQRRLLVRHEQEHMRARDPGLLLLGLAALVAAPWNPVVWWQLRRLRSAIEVDCDGRVLARDGVVGQYGKLLLEVASRVTSPPFAAAAFTTGSHQLQRRVEVMTGGSRKHRGLASLCGSVAAVALLVAACQVDQPAEPPAQPGSSEADVVGISQAVVATPDAGDAGPETDASGADPSGTGTSAGPPSSDDAPAAETQEEAIAGTDAGNADRSGAAPVTGVDITAEPTFTPMEIRPELRNRVEFQRELERRYPAMLKDAGIGGRVNLWVYIDESGEVANARLVESSGQPELDRVAEQLMRDVARFSPAVNRQEPVPVWIQLPITFQSVRQ